MQKNNEQEPSEAEASRMIPHGVMRVYVSELNPCRRAEIGLGLTGHCNYGVAT